MMKITNDTGKVVDDVQRIEGIRDEVWVKLVDGAIRYYIGPGWREVKPARRDVTGEVGIKIDTHCVYFEHNGTDVHNTAKGYHFEKVTMYDLPSIYSPKVAWRFITANHFYKWLEQFSRPCIIITKEE